MVVGLMSTRVVCARMAMCRLRRVRTGRRKALAVLQREPRRMVPVSARVNQPGFKS